VSWMSFIASTLHPARPAGARSCARGSTRSPIGAWARLDIGERYSIADIHLFRLYWRMFNSLKPARGEFPNLDAHYARMMRGRR